MAYVTTDRRTGNYLVRAYAGIRPDTGRPFSVSETLPAMVTEAEIDEGCAAQLRTLRTQETA